MKTKRKPRAMNVSPKYKKEILELSGQGMTPAEIYKKLAGVVTYWQVYNTINPRLPAIEPGDEAVEQDEVIGSLPDIELSQFESIEQYIEHSITAIANELNSKKIGVDRRVNLLSKLQDIQRKVRASQVEKSLKDANAKLIIRMMRRLKPDLTDEELLQIYHEEAERLKMESRG